MKQQISVKLKATLAVCAFIFSIAFGIAAFCCPPLAIIDNSILWFIAQLLCFSATLLGFSMTIDSLNHIVKGGKEKDDETNE